MLKSIFLTGIMLIIAQSTWATTEVICNTAHTVPTKAYLANADSINKRIALLESQGNRVSVQLTSSTGGAGTGSNDSRGIHLIVIDRICAVLTY